MAGAFFGILCALSGSAELLGIIVGLEAWPGLSFKQKPHNRNLFAEGFVENQFSERHDGFVMVSAGDAGILPLPLCFRKVPDSVFSSCFFSCFQPEPVGLKLLENRSRGQSVTCRFYIPQILSMFNRAGGTAHQGKGTCASCLDLRQLWPSALRMQSLHLTSAVTKPPATGPAFPSKNLNNESVSFPSAEGGRGRLRQTLTVPGLIFRNSLQE